MKLSTQDTAILVRAIALLDSPLTCEPLAVLSVAAGTDISAVARIQRFEREFSANGKLWNSAPHRKASLGAVLRFYGSVQS